MIQMRHKKPAGVEDLGPENPKMQIIDYGKVSDSEIIANTDHGLCLSMHQPYASLLVAGVKKFVHVIKFFLTDYDCLQA